MKKIILILFLLPYFLLGQNIDSLKFALKNAKHDTTQCNILSILVETASDEEWPAFNEQLKTLAEKNITNNSALKQFYLKHLAFTFENIGYLAYTKSNIPKALEYSFKALEIQEKIENKNRIAYSLNNIGSFYNLQGDIPKALEYYHKSLKIYYEIEDEQGIATSLNNLGLIYYNQGDDLKALEYYNKSIKIYENIKDKKGVAGALNNIALIYDGEGDNQKKLEYLLKSLAIYEEIGHKQGIANTLSNIGVIYCKQGSFSKGIECYSKSLRIQEEIGEKQGIAKSLMNIGNALMGQGKIEEALTYANKSLVISKELNLPENLYDIALSLKKIFQKQNKYKEAFEMYELEIKMRDSINNEETQKAVVKKQMQYEYETQAKELKNEQDKKDIIAKAELNQREKERNYFVMGFALVIVLALFILRGYRQKQKANLIITQQKYEVEESRKEILDSIHYAKRIQKAHLPSDNYIEKNLNRLQKKG